MYRWTNDGGIERIDDGVFIPNSPHDPAWQEVEAWVKDGNEIHPIDPALRAEISMRIFEEAIEAHIEATAQAVNPNTGHQRYSSAQSCASYVASTNPAWKAEAETFVAWRDDVWTQAFTELAKVQAGERDEPSVEAFIAELPAITWPA